MKILQIVIYFNEIFKFEGGVVMYTNNYTFLDISAYSFIIYSIKYIFTLIKKKKKI